MIELYLILAFWLAIALFPIANAYAESKPRSIIAVLVCVIYMFITIGHARGYKLIFQLSMLALFIVGASIIIVTEIWPKLAALKSRLTTYIRTQNKNTALEQLQEEIKLLRTKLESIEQANNSTARQ